MHREILREAMVTEGFVSDRMERWHFDVPGAGRSPIQDVPLR